MCSQVVHNIEHFSVTRNARYSLLLARISQRNTNSTVGSEAVVKQAMTITVRKIAMLKKQRIWWQQF